ncbi:MAG: VOC family protein [Candidatus Uhrbacteria bacterium]
MIQFLDQFFQQARESVATFDAWVAAFVPDLSSEAVAKVDAIADHLCYKCSSRDEFESIRSLLETSSAFVYQSIISNRRIAIIKFLTPIPSALGAIWFLELSDQKPDGSQASGFDHVEIYPTGGTMDELAIDLEAKGTVVEKVVRPHHTTYDIVVRGTFKVRIEPDALVAKIKRDEMR